MRRVAPPPPPNRSLLWRAAACLLLTPLAAAAQPEVSLDPSTVISDAQSAYRTGPVADEVTVTLRPEGPIGLSSNARRERFIGRLFPEPEATDGSTRALLELGALRVFMERGRAAATHAHDPSSVFVVECPGHPSPAMLAAVLPPVPWPQLALADASDPGLSAPTPYTRNVRWRTATLDAATRPPTATVQGQGDSGPVSLTINAETGRLLRLAARVSSDPPIVLEITSRPIEPGDPPTWDSFCQDRQPIGSLADLASRSAAPVQPGTVAPEIVLLGPELDQWSLTTAIAATEQPRPAAVLLFRLPRDENAAAAVTRDAELARAALHAVANGPNELASAAGIVIELSDYTRGGFDALRRAWADRRAPARLGVDELRWAASAAQTIDRFAPGAQAALIVVGPDRRVREIVRLDGMAAEPAALDALAKRVRNAMALRPDEPAD